MREQSKEQYEDQLREELGEDFRDRVFHIKDPQSGELLHGEMDDRYAEIKARWHDSECNHPTTTPMQCRFSNGSLHIFEVCETCFEKVGSALSKKGKEDWASSLPLLENKQSFSYVHDRHKTLKRELVELARNQIAERGEFTRFYKDYLSSDAWRRKRELVFQRSRGKCEACGEADATEVHHHTYEHLGDELLWELAAVCNSCHVRITEEVRERRNG